MEITSAFFLFVLGLLVGSFLNVVVFRMERQVSFVGGRSRCLSCNHQLAWYDNIPLLSFLYLQGKCRYCSTKLSWQYPIVEMVTGILFALSFLILKNYSEWLQLGVAFFLLLSICFAILITVYDLRFSVIPDVFLWGINLSAAGFLGLHWLFIPEGVVQFLPDFYSAVFGALVAGGFFFLLVSFSKETWMGWGDVWLGIWGGMLVGLPLIQIFITLSFTLGAVVGLGLLYRQKKTLKAELPFAPYLLLAGFFILGAMYQFPAFLQFLSPWLPGTIE